MELHASGEDYLEALLILLERKGTVRAVDVALYLERTKPSVSRAVARLEEGGFLQRFGGRLSLTENGFAVAKGMLDRRRFFFSQLTAIGVDPQIAERDARRVKHAVSDESFRLIKEEAARASRTCAAP